MATATITLSSDIQSDNLEFFKDKILYKAGTEQNLDQTTGLNKIILTATTNIVLLDSSAAGVGKAAKVYIANKSTDASEFVTITINAQIVGRLYAGDWMFIPWSQSDAAGNIELAPSVATALTVEYMTMHEGLTPVSA
tara:strand:+ start:174 stop:587 length:414 start_codon:yes stop_codon:yes gene_type:complete